MFWEESLQVELKWRTSFDESKIAKYDVKDFSNASGLIILTLIHCRRIAAIVFYIIEDSNNPNKNKLYPNYKQLAGKVFEAGTRAAKLLIHLNLDTVNNIREFLKYEMISVIISSAITIVLFQLLEVNPAIFSSGRGQESLAAINAFGELTINAFSERFLEKNAETMMN
jgi:hypothetical protein